ncbi:hypothetical protein ACFP1I_09705 [Dyadobacter subterraneus]|uniref:Lipoprotein n=1 Tax=Dyadobacter subterraneus TaxID=2773304 RepID=A0ABR9WAX9_9BACT|nr:hypothetical protein [Dyadobacter subterraneus]MBE9462623.1 hypothetical protein [Dyadobacter subterraneus]
MKLLNFKKLIAPLLFVLILCSFNSCCTNRGCFGADDMNQIYFYGFTPQEVDTIVIKRFDRNSSFKTVLDSVQAFSMPAEAGSSFQIILIDDQDKLHIDFDYKIEIPASGKTFTISDFVIRKERCNTGFLCNDFYNDLNSYKLNGKVTATSGILEIHK